MKLQHHLSNSSLHEPSRALLSLDELVSSVEVLEEHLDASWSPALSHKPASQRYPRSGRPLLLVTHT